MKEIKLTQGKVALVDDEDYEELNKYKWYANKIRNTYYAMRHMSKNHKKIILMHREVMDLSNKMFVDHIDGNGLNNCKSNLRAVTNRQNLQKQNIKKSSKYVGVYLDKRTNKWKATIRINKKQTYLGCFNSELEAHEEYLKALDSMGEIFVDNI